MVQHDLVRPQPLVVARLSLDFVLEATRAVTHHLNGDILGGLTFLAMLQGYYAQNGVKPAANGGLAFPEARPVSVQSLALSLITPPETMRRCVARLTKKGWIERVPASGVAISNTGQAREEIALLMKDIRTAFHRMIAALKGIDFDFDVMGQAVEQNPAVTPDMAGLADGAARAETASPEMVIAVDRIILDFGIRIAEGGKSHFGNDYVMTCVFAAISSANAAAIAYSPREAWRYANYESVPPDSARRPASLKEISQILGIPYETARRYVNTLIARGHCVRDERKLLLIPVALLQSPEAMLTGMEVVRRFVEAISELKRLGFDFRAGDAKNLPSTAE